jgi:gliding motility-associated-like protein
MKRILLAQLFLFIALECLAQAPAINNISVMNLYPKGKVVITGSGFSSTSSQLQVWFGQAKGTVTSSTEFTIEVEVPAAASLANIEVINTATRRSATSGLKFTPSFSGEAFDVTRFTGPTSFTSPNELRDLCSVDLNNDGMADIVATKFSAATDMLILQNTSTGPGNISFSKIAYPLNFSSDHVVAGDVDADGFQDLVITKGGASNRNTVFVVRNTSTTGGSVSLNLTPFSLPLETNNVALRSALRDLNGDGRPEIVVTNLTNNVIYIFQNDPLKPLGANPFITTPLKITVTDMSTTYGLDVQDFNGDGKADILLNAVASANHYILPNRTSSNTIDFGPAQRITLAGQLRNVTSADVNNDGKLDLITTSTGTNIVNVLINQSSGSTFAFSSTPIQLAADNAPWGVSIADMEGDGDPDIIVSNQLVATTHVYVHDGNFASPAFSKQTLTTPRPARNVIAADLDSDGRPEISTASFVIGSYSIDVFRNTICHKPKILNEEPIYVCNNPVELKTIPAINVTFDWRQGASSVKNSADPFLSTSNGGSYTVYTSSVNPAGECTSIASQTINVTGSAGSVPENPTITLSSNSLCSGATLNLSTPDVTAGASYKWTGPNWTTTTTGASTSLPNVAGANAGEYTVQIIVGNCKSNVSPGKVLSVVAVDNFAITSNSPTFAACSPSQVKLSVNSVSGFTYAWKRNTDAYPSSSTVNTYDAALDGNYYVKISNVSLGCPDREVGPVKVTILNAPIADFTIGEPRCANAPINFDNNAIVDNDAVGDVEVQYTWDFNNGQSSTERDATMTFVNAAITYNVKLTVAYRGAIGCGAATATKTIPLAVTAASVPSITAGVNALCPGDETNLLVAGTYTSLNWEHGATGSPISVSAPGVYKVNGTDANGCVVPGSIEIGQKETPEITITPESATIPSGQSVQLMALGAHTFTWTPSETLNSANVPDPIATPLTTTTYKVVGEFTDGCSGEAEVTIMVDVSQIDITIPLAFSPNGDPDNERWEIEGIEKYPDCTMNIFDSRGKRVYQRKGYDNQWDGTYEGKPVPSGTYYYVFGCPDGSPLTGSVLIFR